MTSRWIKTRHSEALGPLTRSTSAARVVNPRSAPDDSGAFCLADARHPHRPSPILLGKAKRSATVRCFTADAKRPCFCCTGGLERCDACKGRGYSEDRDTCDYCLGIGYSNCDFCGGSGLVACDSIAPDRRLSVAMERIGEAARQLRVIMERPAPSFSRDEPRRSLQDGGRALLQINRFVAMIEDGLHILETAPMDALVDKGKRSRVIRFCLKLAIACERRMREIISEMAVSARAAAQLSEPRKGSREVATNRAVFYASLLERSGLLTGTGFERPLLSAAFAKLNEAPASPTLERDRPKEEP